MSNEEVTPTITKTDARELKTLVRRDHEFLREELRNRREQLFSQLNEEQERRDEEDKQAVKSEMRNLFRRVKNLNDAIVEKLEELSEDGWTTRRRGYYVSGGEIDPHAFTVETHFNTLVPPTRDNSDLEEARALVTDQYNKATSSLNRQESDYLRDLTLQSVTTEAAKEFILDLPTPESLLPAPEVLQLEA